MVVPLSKDTKEVIEHVLGRLPNEFPLAELQARAEPLLLREQAPFVAVILQECARMNALLSEIRRSLIELAKGLDGQLNMSEGMEDLASALSRNEVPGRNPFHKCSWEKLAWSSNRPLAGWFADLLLRIGQLDVWTGTLEVSRAVWLPGLFNPSAFLTAIMQVTARRKKHPLDSMTVETHVTIWKSPDLIDSEAVDGAYVHGLFLEGARWQLEDETGNFVNPYKVDKTPCAGFLAEGILKDLLPPLPVVLIRAVAVNPAWIPTSVGYLRQDNFLYECPVYLTRSRGATFVTLATLRSLDVTEKWVLAGVAIILQKDV